MRLWLAPASDAPSAVNPGGDQRRRQEENRAHQDPQNLRRHAHRLAGGGGASARRSARPVPDAYTPAGCSVPTWSRACRAAGRCRSR